MKPKEKNLECISGTFDLQMIWKISISSDICRKHRILLAILSSFCINLEKYSTYHSAIHKQAKKKSGSRFTFFGEKSLASEISKVIQLTT